MNHEHGETGHRSSFHSCGFYSNSHEQWNLVVPFIQQGLQQGQKCLYVAEEHDVREVQTALQERGIPALTYLERGQLLIVMARNTCLAPDPFSLDALLNELKEMVRQVRAEGHQGLCIAVEMSWVLERPASLAYLSEYEARMNTLLLDLPCVLLCQYNQQRFPAENLLGALKTHPEVRIGSVVHLNPYYLPPRILLQQDKKEQFQWYLKSLCSSRWEIRQEHEAQATELASRSFQSLLEIPQHVRGPAWSPWEVNCKVSLIIPNLRTDPVTQLDAFGSPRRWQLYCLGRLRVYRNDGTQVAWDVARSAPTKVKTLFAFLLARGQAGATREELVDLLWPDQDDLEKGLTRLYHTVHCLRRALEPDLAEQGKRSRFVLHEGDRYFLALPEGSWIDVLAFEEFCYQGEYLARLGRDDDALACYLAADRLYAGDYLADIPLEYTERLDIDWCWSRRFWLKEMYIKLFLCIAELYLNRGAYREALAYYRKALTEDPTREEAHQGMMRVFRQAGRRDALARQYRLWQELMLHGDDELAGAETADRTRNSCANHPQQMGDRASDR